MHVAHAKLQPRDIHAGIGPYFCNPAWSCQLAPFLTSPPEKAEKCDGKIISMAQFRKSGTVELVHCYKVQQMWGDIRLSFNFFFTFYTMSRIIQNSMN